MIYLFIFQLFLILWHAIADLDEASMEIWSVALDDMTRSLEITWPLIEKEVCRFACMFFNRIVMI